MRILVCVKRVPAPGARINITPDGQAIDTAYLGFTMSPHEECAVEEAVQLVERHGGEATVLTLGPAEADEQLRYAASLGAAKAVLLPIDGPDWDPQRTASAITAAIGGLESADGPFDLILFESHLHRYIKKFNLYLPRCGDFGAVLFIFWWIRQPI